MIRLAEGGPADSFSLVIVVNGSATAVRFDCGRTVAANIQPIIIPQGDVSQG